MNTADLITSFFNNEMSPDQERQFLLSVASSDSLRLGLKSHVMLDKILHEQSSQSRVPVEVRMNILKQAAVVAATGTALSADDAMANTEKAAENVATASLAGSRRFFRWSSATLALLMGIGIFIAGFYTGTENSEGAAPVATQVQGNRPTISPVEGTIQSPVFSASTSGQNGTERVAAEPVQQEKTVSSSSMQRGERSGSRVTNSEASRNSSSNTPDNGKAGTASAGHGATQSPPASVGIGTSPLQIIETNSEKK